MIRRILKGLMDEKLDEKEHKLLRYNCLIILLSFISSGILLKFVPKELPMHWQNDGSITYTLPSYIGIWVGPAVLLVVNVIFTKQKRINIINTLVLAILSIVIVFMYYSTI